MERVRYDLLLVINTLTLVVVCNFAVWAVLLCVSVHQHHVPFLGIQPSNVPTIGSLEQMSKYAKNMRPNRSAPSSFNSSFNLWTIPFAGTMMLLDSIPSSYPCPIPRNRSSSFVKCFSVFLAVTLLLDSRLKLADIGHFNNDFKPSKTSQCEISNGFL